MSWLDPPEEQEYPLIENICPHCKAVNITLNETTHIKDVWFKESYEPEPNEEYLYSIYKCTYCNSEVINTNLDCCYSDDFADLVTDYLPEGWLVSSTGYGSTWHEVEISYDLGVELVFPSIITIKLTEKGHIDWNQVKEDCIKVNESFFNKEEIELLKQLDI